MYMVFFKEGAARSVASTNIYVIIECESCIPEVCIIQFRYIHRKHHVPRLYPLPYQDYRLLDGNN